MRFCGVEGGAGRDAETVGGLLHVFTVSTVSGRYWWMYVPLRHLNLPRKINPKQLVVLERFFDACTCPWCFWIAW